MCEHLATHSVIANDDRALQAMSKWQAELSALSSDPSSVEMARLQTDADAESVRRQNTCLGIRKIARGCDSVLGS